MVSIMYDHKVLIAFLVAKYYYQAKGLDTYYTEHLKLLIWL